MARNNENNPRPSQSHDMFMNLLENNPPSLSSTNQGQTSNPSSSTYNNPPPYWLNPYSQPYYNSIGYNPAMGPYTGSERTASYSHQQHLFEQQQQQQQFSQRTPPLNVNDNVPEWDSVASADSEDEVEEVATDKRRKAKKPLEKRNWTDADCVLLSRCWVHSSEDPVTGISMTEGLFWGKVCSLFNEQTKEAKRTKSQIHGKWNKIKKAVKEFGGAYKKVSEQGRQSGADEKHVFDAAVKLYKKQSGEKKFAYEDCYHILKGVAKFWDEHGVMGKRSVPAIDLTADDQPGGSTQPGALNPAMEALFASDPIRRAPGRNVSRRLSSSSDATSGRSTGSEVAEGIKKYVEKQQEALERAEIQNAMKFLAKPIPTGLSRKDLKAHMAYQKYLEEEFGSKFYAAGDSDQSDEDEDDE